MDYNNIDERDHEEENGPFVKEVVLPPAIYNHAVNRGYQTYKEVGFYLIGLFKKGICYVHDLVEFEYSEQSGGFIESDMARFFRLKTGIPMGLRIVGHLHKHPGFTSYSSTDKQNFLRYGHSNPLNAFLIYMVEPHTKISGYTATAEKIFNVPVTIRELAPDEMLTEKKLNVEFKTKILLPQNSDESEVARVFSENIGSEALKYLSRPSVHTVEVEGNTTTEPTVKVVPRKAVEIQDVGNNKKLLYRVFMEETETIRDLETVFRRMVNVPGMRGYDLVFYHGGQKLSSDTAIAAISLPLIWNMEKSVLSDPLKNFVQFLSKLVGILKEKEKEIEKEKEEAVEEVASKKLPEPPKELPEIQEKVESSSEPRAIEDQEKVTAAMSHPKKEDTPSLTKETAPTEIKRDSELVGVEKKAEDDLRKKRKEVRRDRLDYFI